MRTRKVCNWEDCKNLSKHKGYCFAHYNLACKRGMFSDYNKCSFEGCDSPVNSHGLCGMHYQRLDSRKKAAKKWYQNNKEYRKVKSKEYRDKPESKQKVLEYWKSPKVRYSGAVKRSLQDNKEFSLDYDEYLELITKKCFYCNGELPSKGTGLDRIDNTRGYHIDNVIPACTFCNKGRNDLFSPEEFKEIIKLIKSMRKKDNIWEGYWWGNGVTTGNGKLKEDK